MSLTEKAYQRIRGAIVQGDLAFGEQLSETQIGKVLGMSKAPVRAAFIRLKDKGLVTMIAHPATLECRIDASEPEQLERLKGTLARHLDRFAFREAPLQFDWHDAG